MLYVALGDSISIDDYTGVRGGGAVSQLARLLAAEELVDLTRDGHVSDGVVADLERLPERADVVTLTVGGNDLLLGRDAPAILADVRAICTRLARLGAIVVVSTVYDPTDGDDALARDLLGLPATMRARFDALNAGLRAAAAEHGFLLADLEALFAGHGLASAEPWFVQLIEPNLAGATAIAAHWRDLIGSVKPESRA